ncbi:hypothetical protein NDU88_006560 [Pleurodeles waltl]|uniref:Small EDRK-rich factor-like N-terminal domain-containing protein n=1 Tax=Pleurodeles waltl TaxID=8319 RepID=A0AAV7SQ78_PLEWA|nr:hypothetical protein NDU88_006560 [Pleurodeles waltl]
MKQDPVQKKEARRRNQAALDAKGTTGTQTSYQQGWSRLGKGLNGDTSWTGSPHTPGCRREPVLRTRASGDMPETSGALPPVTLTHPCWTHRHDQRGSSEGDHVASVRVACTVGDKMQGRGRSVTEK